MVLNPLSIHWLFASITISWRENKFHFLFELGSLADKSRWIIWLEMVINIDKTVSCTGMGSTWAFDDLTHELFKLYYERLAEIKFKFYNHLFILKINLHTLVIILLVVQVFNIKASFSTSWLNLLFHIMWEQNSLTFLWVCFRLMFWHWRALSCIITPSQIQGKTIY